MNTTPQPNNDDRISELLKLADRIGLERALSALKTQPQRPRPGGPAVVRFDGAPVDPETEGGTVQFPTIARDPYQIPFDLRDCITLRLWYERCMLPDYKVNLAKRTLAEDRVALNRWEDVFGNIDLRSVGTPHLEEFRDGLLRRGCGPSSVNKYWREIKSMFRDAQRRGLIQNIPRISIRSGCNLVKVPPKRQRPIVTEAELARIWKATNHATYPVKSRIPAPKLWRVALVLLWTYGMRTMDLLKLEWDDIDFEQRTITFTAMKTRKLQGLPLTDTVIAQLKSLSNMQGQFASRLFPSFKSAGHHVNRKPKLRGAKWAEKLYRDGWKRGYYATWRNEILAQAGILIPIQFKHFRQAMVTRYNEVEPGLGAWMAGHYVPGVTAQHYDLPTKRIRAAIEAAPVPQCFEQLD